jgi:peptide/nickel transport system permease protein
VSTPLSPASTEPVVGAGRLAAGAAHRIRPFLNVYWAMIAGFVLIATFAPLIAPADPVRADLLQKLQPPSSEHLSGTDSNGMDVFSRVLYATRTDFTIATLGVAAGMVVGVPLGAASGYLGGIVGEALSRLAETVQAIPLFLFGLMVFAALGNSKPVLVAVIASVNAPIFLKLTRAVVLPIRDSDYIAAARCAGLRPGAVILRHVLPNSLGPVASQMSISCAYAIQIVAGLSFLGLGVRIPEPEWGSMIQEGASRVLYGEWWVSVFPGLAVLLAVMAFGGVGRSLSGWYGR